VLLAGRQRDDLAALDHRVEQAAAAMAPASAVRDLGSILLREDEVVLCHFEGAAATVREVAERAQVPFERILAAGSPPWPPSNPEGSA
jgi:hypothetical protein